MGTQCHSLSASAQHVVKWPGVFDLGDQCRQYEGHTIWSYRHNSMRSGFKQAISMQSPAIHNQTGLQSWQTSHFLDCHIMIQSSEGPDVGLGLRHSQPVYTACHTAAQLSILPTQPAASQWVCQSGHLSTLSIMGQVDCYKQVDMLHL